MEARILQLEVQLLMKGIVSAINITKHNVFSPLIFRHTNLVMCRIIDFLLPEDIHEE